MQEGRRWAADIDLEKFFDRVNHDILMSRIARQVSDARVLKLIRRYLEAGLMREGRMTKRREGTPQGGPLSPLLSNILLTDWDRELERRGHAFCRYADDCNIYVRSKTAGDRLLMQMKRFLADRLRLQINDAKSACARPWARKFLGYSLTAHRQARLRIAPPSLQRLMERVKELLRQGRGRSLTHTIETLNPVLRGWIGYFKYTALPALAASKAPARPNHDAASAEAKGRSRMALGPQWARPVVEFGCVTHECCLPETLL